MKRIYVNEQWCLGCHLCEYECAYANSGIVGMAKALKGKAIHPRLRVEDAGDIHFAVNCRHCTDPVCVQSCISGALTKGEDGIVRIDKQKMRRLPHLRARLPLRRGAALPRWPRRHEMPAVHRQRQRYAQLRQILPQRRHRL